MYKIFPGILLSLFFFSSGSQAQDALPKKFNNSTTYCGIEVGSKGVKMSVIEMGKNAQTTGAYNIVKDSSYNTDFISFNESSFEATLNSLSGIYNKALNDYNIPSNRIFTVVSSGVKMQAEKENKKEWVNKLIEDFREKIKEPQRKVDVVDVITEAKLSHLGIVPESRRYSTFLLDIGSGNTKGGFFPGGNTDYFKLFEINWGTKSTSNGAEKRLDNNDALDNYERQLQRVLFSAENPEIIYAVNASGAYPLSDNIAVSGGIAWAVATLLHPEQMDKSVIAVNYDEVMEFSDNLFKDYSRYLADNLAENVAKADRKEVQKAASVVNKVFDQRSMMAGTGLLLKIMRQFVSAFETKQFYLVKNGHVGWVSAYVDETINQ